MVSFYTITEAADICSVNRSTMHRWVASGKIKSYSTPGGRKRIQKSDLKTFLEENHMPVELLTESDDHREMKKRILIVDDDIDIQDYLKSLLSGPFMELEVASDGFEAGVKLMAFNPDLIILDLNMPKQDGFQVCRTIKENSSTRHIRILIITGHNTPENRTKAFELGADGFLSKPAPMKELLSEVERLLTS